MATRVRDRHERAFDPYSGALYEVEVVDILKGRPDQKVVWFSENSTARFWLDVGASYLFFVSEEVFDFEIGKRLKIDTCGNSDFLKNAKASLKLLHQASAAARRNR